MGELNSPGCSKTAEIEISKIKIDWDLGRGTCSFSSLPVIMMWVDTTLAGLMSGFQTMVGPERFMLALQAEGRRSVEADWQVISGFPEFADGFRAIAKIAAVAGWGEWTLVSCDVGKQECRFRVEESWEGRYQKALGICLGSGMFAGKMAGYTSKLFATNCWAEQTAFIARGDAYDEFLVRPSARTVEQEVDELLQTDDATRADMAVALAKLQQEIAERERVEQQLRHSHSLLTATLESTADGLLVVDSGGKINSFNRRFIELWRIPEDLVASKDDTKLLGFVLEQLKDPDSFIAKVQELYRNPDKSSWDELEFLDGRVFERYSQPQRLGDTVVGRVWSFRDVTEHKQAQNSLERESQKNAALLRNASDGIHILDTNGCLIEASDSFCQMLGYSREEMIGMHVSQWDAVLSKPELNSKLLEQLKRPVRSQFESKHRRKDGSLFDVELSGYPAEWGGRQFLFNSSRDISKRKLAVEKLRASEEKYRGIFDGSVAAIYTFDSDKRFIDSNQAGLELLGYSCEELLQLNIAEVDIDPDAVLPAYQQLLTGGKLINYEHRLRRKDGSVVTVLNNSQPLTDDQGTVVGMLSTLVDISERKQAEEMQARLEDQLRQSQRLESVGRLAGGVAHDFNNMLGLIMGRAELALMQVDPSQRLHSHLEEICSAANRSANLTRQLLTFARQQAVEQRVINLNDAAREILTLLQRLVGENIDLSFHAGPGLWPVKADPSQIDQVLTNLCINARDSIAGVGAITIETGNNVVEEVPSCQNCSPGEYVKLVVSDNGGGISKEVLEHIFEPFFTTKPSGEGTGLGLATVYGAVRQNGGCITVASEPGQGTTFTIYLPRYQGEAEQGQQQEVGSASEPEHQTILLVEDEADLLSLYQEVLVRQGYHVLAKSSPRAALQLAEEYEGEIHLLITDVVMPELNGRQLADTLTLLRPGLKSLFMSGYTANIIDQHGVPEEELLQKPFSFKVLLAKVNEILHRE